MGTPAENRPFAGVATTAAKIFALVGILTFVTVAFAIIAGLWLDDRLDTRPLFTVVFVLVSVPVSFIVILRVTMAQVKQMQSASSKNQINQLSEGEHGRD